MAGAGAERQETGFVNAINRAVKKNGGKGIRVQTSGSALTNIIRAEKFSGRSSAGTEPYTDVILHSQGGRRWNLSMKGESAPSLAGGGLEGLELIVPGIGGRFIKSAYRAYIRAGYKRGDELPDAYATVPGNLKTRINQQKRQPPSQSSYSRKKEHRRINLDKERPQTNQHKRAAPTLWQPINHISQKQRPNTTNQEN